MFMPLILPRGYTRQRDISTRHGDGEQRGLLCVALGLWRHFRRRRWAGGRGWGRGESVLRGARRAAYDASGARAHACTGSVCVAPALRMSRAAVWQRGGSARGCIVLPYHSCAGRCPVFCDAFIIGVDTNGYRASFLTSCGNTLLFCGYHNVELSDIEGTINIDKAGCAV